MATRYGLALTMALMLAGTAAAQSTVIVQDNFDQYANTGEFLQQWVPTTGLGTAAIDPGDTLNYTAGVLTSDPITSPANFPGVQGLAVDHVGAAATTPGMVNQWGGVIDHLGNDPAFQVAPSASQKVHLSFDMFMGISGNERLTVGLRHTAASADGADTDTFPDAVTSNILELGAYNGAPNTPIVPGAETQSANFGFRVINFGAVSDPLTAQPNWQYFKFDSAALNRPADTDPLVNIADIGAGWHTYAATITPTEIRLTVDLFRDGFKNVRDEAGVIVIGSGDEGVDAEIILPIATLPVGFNNLRFGGPSGASSPGGGFMGFDNILLETQAVSVPTINADFNGDDIVDGNDFLIWQRNFNTGNAFAQGDANNSGTVDAADLAVWKDQFGTNPNAAPAVGAIPEPATASLAAVVMLASLAYARRKQA